MTRVLITGAGGFVCSNIALSILQRGCEVIGVDRAFDPMMAALLQSHGASLITSDLSSLPDLEVDYVVHGAAITADPVDGETPEDHFRANIDPALTMLDWAKDHRVRRTVFISSSAVFRGSSAAVLTEDTPVATDGLLYAVEKHTIELLIKTLKHHYHRDAVAVRLGSIYGCYEIVRPSRPRVSLVARLIDDALRKGQVTVPASMHPVDWTFAGDVGAALCALMEAPTLPHALYHVTSGDTWSAPEIALVLRDVLPNLSIEIDHDTNVPFRGYMQPHRLLADTHFNAWTDFRSGLHQTVQWFKAQKEQQS